MLAAAGVPVLAASSVMGWAARSLWLWAVDDDAWLPALNLLGVLPSALGIDDLLGVVTVVLPGVVVAPACAAASPFTVSSCGRRLAFCT